MGLIDPLILITGAKAVSGLFGHGSGRVYSLSYAAFVGDSFPEEVDNCDEQGDAGAFCTGVCVCVVCVCVVCVCAHVCVVCVCMCVCGVCARVCMWCVGVCACVRACV